MPGRMTIKTEPPSSVVVGTTFGLTVQVDNGLGNPAGGTVTVALGNNPGDATLGGTLTAPVEDGVATFSDLTLSQAGSGYTLTVTASAIAGTLTTHSDHRHGRQQRHQDRARQRLPTAPMFGQTVTLDATVSLVSPGGGVPTGSVTFKDGSTTLGTADAHRRRCRTVDDRLQPRADRRSRPRMAATRTISPAASISPLTVGTGGGHARVRQSELHLQRLAPEPRVSAPVPGGLSGVTLTYSQNGVACIEPDPRGRLHGDGHAQQSELHGARP